MKIEVSVNRICLLTQPQKELQLDLKANNTQDSQKSDLYRSLMTKDLKKPHSSRRVGRTERRRGGEVRRHDVVRRGSGSGPTSTCGG